MKNIIKTIAPYLMLVILAFTYSSCVKKEFDEPPVNGTDPALTVNRTIKQLKALWPGSGIVTITDDIIIAGIVVGDDESGNFYKSIVIQDSTAGINIQLDASGYWRNYKVGRRVFVKCKGLVLGDYGKQVQLGGYIDNSTGTPSVGRIPLALIPHYLYGGVWDLPVTPLEVNSISQLNLTADQNKLVTIHGVYFVSSSSCLPWADIAGQTSGNRVMQDTINPSASITVRTSNFATFAASLTPSDTGTITGVFQQYNSTYQLVIRDLNDVHITSNKCCVNPTILSIDSVRKMLTGTYALAGNCTAIKGVVISDKNNNNITGKNIMLQDNSTPVPHGIIVRFTATNTTFALGDELEINISGDTISKYNGAMQITYVDPSKTTRIASGQSVTPRITTIADINANIGQWESTLVKISNVTLNSGTPGIYSGNVTLNDGTGTMTMYTIGTGSFPATFATDSFPTFATSIIGYLSLYNSSPELEIRNLTDVTP